MTDGNGLRVLVVDDHPEMAEMIADALSDRGYVAQSASTGADAVRLLGVERFDAVVTDVTMPGVDGFDVLAASRDLDPSRPVILMTAFSAIEQALQASEEGAYQYLLKPFRLDALEKALDKALRGR